MIQTSHVFESDLTSPPKYLNDVAWPLRVDELALAWDLIINLPSDEDVVSALLPIGLGTGRLGAKDGGGLNV